MDIGMQGQNRDYGYWMDAVAKKKRVCPDLNLVIRHDIDFDIHTARAMMEVERERGLSSVIYVDVHSPSYSVADIVALHKDFVFDGFEFGIHINMAYDNDGPKACWKAYLDDLKLLKDHGIEPHSCVAHFYDERLAPVPAYDNLAVEMQSDRHHTKGTPRAFVKACLFGSFVKLGDGGGLLACDVPSWVDSLTALYDAYLSLHPVHFAINPSYGVYYTKKIGGKKNITEHDINTAFVSVKKQLPTYFRFGISLFHLSYCLRILNDILNAGYRKLTTIVDAGCGFGLLGAYLMHRHNVKYIGIDVESEFINIGDTFFEKLGLAPTLRVGNLYNGLPKGDILVHLAYEDCEVDYGQLLGICKDFPYIIITIISQEKLEAAKEKGKQYAFIAQDEFEKIYGEFFHILVTLKQTKGRILYCLKRKAG